MLVVENTSNSEFLYKVELLNKISELEKENEELKKNIYKTYINDKGEVEFVFDNFICKDKIREKIKEIEENEPYNTGFDIAQLATYRELLEE